MEVSEASRRILASLLEAKTGQQLSMNRRWRIETALASIMRERSYDSIDQLVSRLVTRADPGLQDAVIEALLNNETYFFRDKLPFDLLMAGPIKRLEKELDGEKNRAVETTQSIQANEHRIGQMSHRLDQLESVLREKDAQIDRLKKRLLQLPEARAENELQQRLDNALVDKAKLEELADSLRQNSEIEKQNQVRLVQSD